MTRRLIYPQKVCVLFVFSIKWASHIYEVTVMYKEFCQLHVPTDVAGDLMGWTWHSLAAILPVLPVL